LFFHNLNNQSVLVLRAACFGLRTLHHFLAVMMDKLFGISFLTCSYMSLFEYTTSSWSYCDRLN